MALVLIACECSGGVREAIAARGHDVWSCDLKPTEIPGQHLQGDLRDHIYAQHWDFIGFHTDCTFMCNSGVWCLKRDPKRHEQLKEACELFNLCLRHPAPGYLENPIPHKYAVEQLDRSYDQLIQPYHFGHPESKATCLWLKGVPKLLPTNKLQKPACGYWDNQTPSGQNKLGPSKSRAADRARTYSGIASAIAEQWFLDQSEFSIMGSE